MISQLDSPFLVLQDYSRLLTLPGWFYKIGDTYDSVSLFIIVCGDTRPDRMQ